MLASEQFWDLWRLTLIYAFATVTFTLTLALIIALTLHRARRPSGFWKALYYLPAILGRRRRGPDDAARLGQPRPRELDPEHLRDHGPGMAIQCRMGDAGADHGQGTGRSGTSSCSSCSAGLGTDEPHEVAELDGASTWATFRAITFPLMTPIVLFNIVLGINAALQVFTQSSSSPRVVRPVRRA